MCGIAGRVGPHAGSSSTIKRMTDSIVHRGPDDEGFYVSDGIELGMRRLAIIDLKGGKQPVSDESGKIQVVFNGEIYNYKALQDGLIKAGHTLKSNSDTEVIAHLYEDHGTNFISMLHGMFAIAIWDSNSNKLILIRDRFGKKPLFYQQNLTGGMDFASEIRALKYSDSSNFNSRNVNPSAINNLLTFGYIHSPDSVFTGIKSLPAGNFLEWKLGSVSEAKPYWAPPINVPEKWSEEEALDQVRKVVFDAVSERMVSERAMGTFLSGGIDSTVVTAIASKLHGKKIQTFSIGFQEKDYDESVYAENVAKYLGTDHKTLVVNPNPVEIIQDLAKTFDQPFADSSAVPTFILSKLARENIVVSLTGDGGDEIFSGYDRYRLVPQLDRLNSILRILEPFKNQISWASKNSNSRKLRSLSRHIIANKDFSSRYLHTMTLIPLAIRQELLNKEFINKDEIAKPESDFISLWNKLESRTSNKVEIMSNLDILTYLPGDILAKVDMTSMNNSLETRSPFLDYRVLDVASRIPHELRIKNGKSKYLLRKLACEFVPNELIDRPKMGFAIPRASWLRGPLKDVTYDLLTDQTCISRGWFNQASINQILKQHMSGIDQDILIWPLLMTELWARNWLDN
ncbi:unannotated protein [freshwater metagenome]|uniref:Unannotated protein n=1 Tax=freshwater metagenome TaxID=449393 RepID=A0A6J6TWD6_9ZZZZ|nr:asparagine synthase (glutamine-hydrolyzing) [Actinomycetota bacterium]